MKGGKYPLYMGTKGYVAPERYDGTNQGEPSAKVDVFRYRKHLCLKPGIPSPLYDCCTCGSFGIMMWEIRHRKYPFEGV